MCKNCPDKFCLLRKIEDLNSADSPASSSCAPPTSERDSVNFELVIIVCWDNCVVFMPPISIASNPTPTSSHPPRIQASESKLRNSSASNQRQTSTLASSHPPSVQASESSFEFRSHQTSTLASSRPSFGIQASNFDRIKPPRRLRHMNIASKLRNPT